MASQIYLYYQRNEGIWGAILRTLLHRKQFSYYIRRINLLLRISTASRVSGTDSASYLLMHGGLFVVKTAVLLIS